QPYFFSKSLSADIVHPLFCGQASRLKSRHANSQNCSLTVANGSETCEYWRTSMEMKNGVNPFGLYAVGRLRTKANEARFEFLNRRSQVLLRYPACRPLRANQSAAIPVSSSGHSGCSANLCGVRRIAYNA